MSWESPPEVYLGFNLTDLSIDQAYLNITSSVGLWLYTLSESCHLCPYTRVKQIGRDAQPHVVSTHHTTQILLRSSGDEQYIRGDSQDLNPVCEVAARFGEFGVYNLRVGEGERAGWVGDSVAGSSTLDCELSTILEPVNENLALLVCFLAYLGLGLAWLGLKHIPGQPIHKLEQWLGWRTTEESKPSRKRLRSLDTFRGISIALMIFVNDGGGGYWFLEHATWNGLLVADLVFPWFLWIMGVCIPMSIKSNLKKKTPTRTVIWQITVRSVKLFLLGFILNTLGCWIELSRLRVPGVLQRFGVCYWVVAVTGFLLSKHRPEDRPLHLMSDLLELLPQWLVMLTVLAIHQLVMYLATVPGCPQGYRGPGGLHDWSPDRNYSHCIGGITGHIDKKFFTESHIYGNPTAKGVYNSEAFDPEGIWGTLTSIFQVWLGFHAGYILQIFPSHKQRIVRWLVWGSITGAIGAILCAGSENDGWVPLNKNLWSISYVMVTTCFAFFLLTLLYFLIDVMNYWKGQPWFFPGMNSILLYCGHSVGYCLFPWHFTAGPMRTHSARLPEALWGTTLWIFISFVLYKKKVFVTV